MNFVDQMALWYLYFTKSLKGFLNPYLPKDNLKVKQILLHYNDGEYLDLTPCIDSNQFHFPDLMSLLKDEKTGMVTQSLVYPDLNHVDGLHLEVIYHQGNEKYRVIYDKNDQISFPPYQMEEVVSHGMIDNYQNGVLFAIYNSQDVTDLIKEFAGPKANFYQDKDIYITMNKMKYALHVYRDKDDPKHELIITDNYAEDHIFKDDNKIILKGTDVPF